MAVRCTKCGEELLGAVNRCWRCGTEFEGQGGNDARPPVRRPPVSSAEPEVLVADLAEPAEGQSAAEPPIRNMAAVTTTIRRGSPFADRGTASLEEVAAPAPQAGNATPARPSYAGFGGAGAGAMLTFPLGVASLLVSFLFPAGGLLLAITGLALGTWGLYSRHRGVALAGLLMCCLCLAVAGFYGTVEFYEQVYGVKPWESADPMLMP